MSLDGQSFLLPLSPTARHREHVGVPHLLEIVRRERGSKSTPAVENQLGVPVGYTLLDVALQNSAPQILCALDVTGGPFAFLANVDDLRPATVDSPAGLVDGYFADAGLCIVDEFQERR